MPKLTDEVLKEFKAKMEHPIIGESDPYRSVAHSLINELLRIQPIIEAAVRVWSSTKAHCESCALSNGLSPDCICEKLNEQAQHSMNALEIALKNAEEI
jgi:hypothetical protein